MCRERGLHSHLTISSSLSQLYSPYSRSVVIWARVFWVWRPVTYSTFSTLLCSSFTSAVKTVISLVSISASLVYCACNLFYSRISRFIFWLNSFFRGCKLRYISKSSSVVLSCKYFRYSLYFFSTSLYSFYMSVKWFNFLKASLMEFIILSVCWKGDLISSLWRSSPSSGLSSRLAKYSRVSLAKVPDGKQVYWVDDNILFAVFFAIW